MDDPEDEAKRDEYMHIALEAFLVGRYLKENGLLKTLRCFLKETPVKMVPKVAGCEDPQNTEASWMRMSLGDVLCELREKRRRMQQYDDILSVLFRELRELHHFNDLMFNAEGDGGTTVDDSVAAAAASSCQAAVRRAIRDYDDMVSDANRCQPSMNCDPAAISSASAGAAAPHLSFPNCNINSPVDPRCLAPAAADHGAGEQYNRHMASPDWSDCTMTSPRRSRRRWGADAGCQPPPQNGEAAVDCGGGGADQQRSPDEVDEEVIEAFISKGCGQTFDNVYENAPFDNGVNNVAIDNGGNSNQQLPEECMTNAPHAINIPKLPIPSHPPQITSPTSPIVSARGRMVERKLSSRL